MKRMVLSTVMVILVTAAAFASAGCVDCDGNGTYDTVGDLCPGGHDFGKAVVPENGDFQGENLFVHK